MLREYGFVQIFPCGELDINFNGYSSFIEFKTNWNVNNLAKELTILYLLNPNDSFNNARVEIKI